jgi:hypothetical protein
VVSRLVARLAAGGPRALKAVRAARAATRQRAWEMAGHAAPGADSGLVTVDIDATIVTSCSEKEKAMPTWKKTYGHHPLAVFADHGPEGSGEPLAFLLRPGNAGSNTAADHIEATRLALPQLPRHLRRRVLIRADSGGGTQDFLAWLAKPGRRLAYSVGFTITEDVQEAILSLPGRLWEPAYDADGQVRPGAWVAELTGLLDLANWPRGMRVIVRKERPHPGAQLRFTDIDGHRFTAFATSTTGGRLADLELRHRRRARCEVRIRCATDTGLRNLPLQGYAQNRSGARSPSWPANCSPGCRWWPSPAKPAAGNPRRLRLRIFSAAGSSAAGGGSGFVSPPAGPGPPRSPPRSPACRPLHPADQPKPSLQSRKDTPRAMEPRPPGATAGPPS